MSKVITNKDRTDRTDKISSLMLIFLQRYGFDQEEAQEEDYYIRDLLCDLKHFCDERGIDFYKELERGENFYDHEVAEEE